MKRIIIFLSNTIICLLILTMICFGQGNKGEQNSIFIKIAAGPEGSTSYVACAKVSALIDEHIPGSIASVMPGGNIENASLVSDRQIDMGWTTVNCAYFAYEGIELYEKPYKNLRIIATCDPSVLQLAVSKRSNIYSYKDLYNKRFNPQPFGTNTRLAAETVLSFYGITFEGIKEDGGVVHALSNNDAATMLQDGKLDAMFAFDGYIPAFLTIAEKPGIRLVGLEPEIIETAIKHPLLKGYFQVTLPADTYKDCDEITTLGVQKVLLVRDDMPVEVANKICKLIYEDEDLKSIFKGATTKGFPEPFTLENIEDSAVIPLHPGLEKYINEQKSE